MPPLDRLSESAPARRAASLVADFKAFAFKGNVVDLAVGVVVGAAFGRIVDALVKHVLMPLVGLVVPGQQSYRDWKWAVGGQEVAYGQLLAEVVNFVAVAGALFVVLRVVLARLRGPDEPPAPPPPTREEELLAEIRDLLKARSG